MLVQKYDSPFASLLPGRAIVVVGPIRRALGALIDAIALAGAITDRWITNAVAGLRRKGVGLG